MNVHINNAMHVTASWTGQLVKIILNKSKLKIHTYLTLNLQLICIQNINTGLPVFRHDPVHAWSTRHGA